MSTNSGLLRAISTIPDIGQTEISETKVGWKQSLLSGKDGNDLVTLHLGKSELAGELLIGQSKSINKSSVKNVGEMINADSLTLGYPLFYIKEALGLKDIPMDTCYDLLYRSASVVLEAERLHIKTAVLVLDNASTETAFGDYENFAHLLKGDGQINCFYKSQLRGRVNLYFGLFDENYDHTH